MAPKTPWDPSEEYDDAGNIITQEDEIIDDSEETDITPSVRVSVSQMKGVPGEPKKGSTGEVNDLPEDVVEEESLQIESESRRKLEQKMSAELQKAGLDTGGVCNHNNEGDLVLVNNVFFQNARTRHIDSISIFCVGRQIEVKIITTGYYNDEDDSIYIISDDETTTFSDMIVKMIVCRLL